MKLEEEGAINDEGNSHRVSWAKGDNPPHGI